jgi:branched-chain amino acid transport system ATP-binding protein
MLSVRSGEIIFQGEPINHLRADQILARGICFVPQERSLFPDMSVRENLRMGGYILNDRHEIERRIQAVFETFPDLATKRGEPARTLSGGQQQMLAMGRTMVLSPAMVLLDEPSLGLAPMIVDQVFEIVRLFREQEMTVLLVEQNARKGLEQSTTGCVLDLGKVHFEAPADHILDDPRIQELYLGSRKDKPA